MQQDKIQRRREAGLHLLNGRITVDGGPRFESTRDIMIDARRRVLREDLLHALEDRRFAAELRQLIGLT